MLHSQDGSGATMVIKDIVLSLPFLTGFLFAFGGGDPVGPIKAPKLFRRLGIGLAIATFSLINQGFNSTCFILLIMFYWIVLALGYGKYIRKEKWGFVAVIGALYGFAGLPLYVQMGMPEFVFIPTITCSTVFVIVCLISSKYKLLTWKFAEGITGVAIGFFPAMIMTCKVVTEGGVQ